MKPQLYPSLHVPERTFYKPLLTGATPTQQLKFADEKFLQDNPVLAIVLPPLNYGTSFTPDGQTVPLAELQSATLTIYSRQNEYLQSWSLTHLLPTSNGIFQPWYFTTPLAIDFTKSYVQFNGAPGGTWTANRVLPFQFLYVTAEEAARMERNNRIHERQLENLAMNLKIQAA